MAGSVTLALVNELLTVLAQRYVDAVEARRDAERVQAALNDAAIRARALLLGPDEQYVIVRLELSRTSGHYSGQLGDPSPVESHASSVTVLSIQPYTGAGIPPPPPPATHSSRPTFETPLARFLSSSQRTSTVFTVNLLVHR